MIWDETMITKIDDQPTETAGLGLIKRRFEVVPGTRTATVQPGRSGGTFGGGFGSNTGDFQILVLDVDAGHRYKVLCKWIRGAHRVWIVDAETGSVVAGEKPPKPGPAQVRSPDRGPIRGGRR